ncbi:hypothetical protein BC938DRAFT_482811 [Jimgerdemannia flammicorona]|uniref:Uncharacterized protein n=1 Tax=Jimgerdemannia flammicorona TaxID=994334 RepID=A0A433QD56_9FUNG|nr:hypothetical protein BC938DRAFT_482811 [Jimgerdemannia flammicorona]
MGSSCPSAPTSLCSLCSPLPYGRDPRAWGEDEDYSAVKKNSSRSAWGATVLIHEASLENDVTQETLEKRRCTVREAAEVGMRMNAFTQHYIVHLTGS